MRPLLTTTLALGAVLALAPAGHAQTAPAPAGQPPAQAGQAVDASGVKPVEMSELPRAVFARSRKQELLTAQVLLDRTRFSPGVIDGYPGGNTERALKVFQETEGLEATGKLDEKTMTRLRSFVQGPVLRRYTITQEDLKGPFLDEVPKGLKAMSQLERVGYTSPEEMLAERFHMDIDLLEALNPDADFDEAGTEIVVAVTRTGKLADKVARIEVDKANDAVRAYAGSGALLASYPATVGSKDLPSPSGTMKVNAVAPDAAYYFDPSKLSFGPKEKLTIPPGPNNPVGGIWIDLEKDGYGIHGTPDPAEIGKTASHGCVRLTNWDAKELAAAVSKGAEVAFVD